MGRYHPTRTILTTEEKAAIIASTRFGGERPQNFDKQQFSEKQEIREAVINVFDRLENIPEQQLRKKLETQIDQAAALWTKEYSISNAPSTEKIKDTAMNFLENISNKVLHGFIDICKGPYCQIVVVPGEITTKDLIEIINKKHKNKKAYIIDNGPFNSIKIWDKEKSNQWKIAIAGIGKEGIMPLNPSINYSNSEEFFHNEEDLKLRTAQDAINLSKKTFDTYGITIMPGYGYIPTAINTESQQKIIIDKEDSFSVVLTANKTMALASFEGWGKFFKLGGKYTKDDVCNQNSRYRPWLEKEIEK